MSCLTLEFKQPTKLRIDLQHIVPDRLLELTVPDIEQLSIGVEGLPARLGDFLCVRDGRRDKLRFLGDFTMCERVGGGMLSGELTIEGSVGDYLACQMHGGQLKVVGSAGRYAAASLRGGVVEIDGDVGDYAAAAEPHALRGMNGGTLVIHGRAGQWLSSSMRRGLVVVHGPIGAGCASRMIAGTLVAANAVELPLGFGMSRGTLLLLEPTPAVLAEGIVGFTPPEPSSLSFLPLLLNEICKFLPPAFAANLDSRRWKRSLGDRAEAGLAELLMLEPPEEAQISQANNVG